MTSDPRQPARRVVYRSVKARVARVAVGLLLVGVTLWIVLPVLASEHAPPAPTALYVGVNDVGPDPLPEPPGSVLKLAIDASGCTNPVIFKGRLDRSEQAWMYDEHKTGINQRGPLPSQASVVLVGARLRAAGIATGALMPSVSKGSILGETPVYGTAKVENLAVGKKITVHNHLSRIVVDPRPGPLVTGALLTSPEWSEARAPLLFVLKADLAFPFGFHRCYLDLPELFGYEEEGRNAYSRAIEFSDPFTLGQTPLGKLTGSGKGQSVSDVAAARSVSINSCARGSREFSRGWRQHNSNWVAIRMPHLFQQQAATKSRPEDVYKPRNRPVYL